MGVRQARIDTIIALLKSKLVWPILAILLLAIFLTTYLPTADAPLGADRVLDATRATTTLTIQEQLTDKTASERADIKATEIAKIDAVARERVSFSAAEYDIEIVDIQKIEGGVEVFARAWTPDGQQIGFGADGSVDIERFRIFNPPILVPDPNGAIVHEGYDDSLKESTYTSYREDPKAALLQDISHTISVKQEKFIGSKIEPGKVGNTTSTFYPAAGTGGDSVDSRVGNNPGTAATWATIHDATDGSYVTPSATNNLALFIDAEITTDRWDNLTRFIVTFPTSSINDGDTISSATLSLYPQATGYTTFAVHNLQVGIVASTPASNSTVVVGDYDQFGTTDFATRKNITAMTSGSYSDFALNASGLANISKTGPSQFGARLGMDIDNVEAWENNKEGGVNIYQADQTGTTNDPKLVVEHAAGGGGSAPKESVWDDV